MAVGKNSLEFIAHMARLAFSDEAIRLMYNHALANDHLCSSSRARWSQSQRWYMENHYGNSEGKQGATDGAAGS